MKVELVAGRPETGRPTKPPLHEAPTPLLQTPLPAHPPRRGTKECASALGRPGAIWQLDNNIKFHRRKRPSVGGRSARDPAGAAASKLWCCICLGCALCCKQVIGRRSKARRSDPTRFGRLCTRERAIRASRAPRPDTILNHGLASEPWLACTANLHAHHFGDLGGELVGLHKHADVGHAPASISH